MLFFLKEKRYMLLLKSIIQLPLSIIYCFRFFLIVILSFPKENNNSSIMINNTTTRESLICYMIMLGNVMVVNIKISNYHLSENKTFIDFFVLFK